MTATVNINNQEIKVKLTREQEKVVLGKVTQYTELYQYYVYKGIFSGKWEVTNEPISDDESYDRFCRYDHYENHAVGNYFIKVSDEEFQEVSSIELCRLLDKKQVRA